MGKNNYFKFKQFKIVQEKSAMKVGTDGVLLGAWVNTNKARSILDLGTGTGLIALMIAQRCNATVTAIEIEKAAYEEACFNFSQSTWNNRINPVFSSFQKFSSGIIEKFDLIVSNPPFFENDLRATEKNRSVARHNDLLSYNDLLKNSTSILSDSGRLSVIIHSKKAEKFINLAAEYNLFVSRQTKVRPNPEKPFHRYLLEFSKKKTEIISDELTIEFKIHHQFTSEFKKLTKDYYLAF
jgi:tRNA1Val (adenine37-N6)-methyltransferase